MDRLTALCNAICASVKHFPHISSYKGASPFKKVAQFVVLFSEYAPIVSVEFFDATDKRSVRIASSLNPFFALSQAVLHLHGASLKHNGTQVELVHPIELSAHSKEDFYAAYRGYRVDHTDELAMSHAVAQHFQRYQQAALLFEQMIYRTNPDAMYPVE